ncbi:hypothetical protein [Winogradskyella sp.]|jgi:hypothetical protein|uniref:hypothetical protein n=1 Tax=Winogradskyella sp. TaxID=1883156 RepID=UPI003F6A0BEC
MRKNNVLQYSLNDSTIAHVARLLQVAMLTGTDVIDHMRTIRLTSDESNSLVLEEEYKSIFDGSLDQMLKNANQKLSESENE